MTVLHYRMGLYTSFKLCKTLYHLGIITWDDVRHVRNEYRNKFSTFDSGLENDE